MQAVIILNKEEVEKDNILNTINNIMKKYFNSYGHSDFVIKNKINCGETDELKDEYKKDNIVFIDHTEIIDKIKNKKFDEIHRKTIMSLKYTIKNMTLLEYFGSEDKISSDYCDYIKFNGKYGVLFNINGFFDSFYLKEPLYDFPVLNIENTFNNKNNFSSGTYISNIDFNKVNEIQIKLADIFYEDYLEYEQIKHEIKDIKTNEYFNFYLKEIENQDIDLLSKEEFIEKYKKLFGVYVDFIFYSDRVEEYNKFGFYEEIQNYDKDLYIILIDCI